MTFLETTTIHERSERIEDTDTVTADLLHGVTAKVERQLWMVRVQVPVG